MLCFAYGNYFLQGEGDASRNADFSLFSVDGEGGDPFQFGNQSWDLVSEIEGQEYDADDTDSFWTAQQEILKEAKEKGIELPDYAEIF